MTAHPSPAAEIRLPCGVVLRPCDAYARRRWIGNIGEIRVSLVPQGVSWYARINGAGDQFPFSFEGAQSNLDSRVLSLRRALAPSDARTRLEIVLNDICGEVAGQYEYGGTPDWDKHVNAVLSALGLAKEEPHHAE